MIKKTGLTTTCFILFFLVANAFSSEPGMRPDETPWFGSVSDKLVDLYEDLYDIKKGRNNEITELQDQLNQEVAELSRKKSDAPNWAIIRKSKNDYDDEIAEINQKYALKIAEKRKKYLKDISEIKDKIVDTMASPATEDIKKKKDAVLKIQYISEMYETYNAILNIREVSRSLNSELRLNLNDYKLASKTYAIQIELLSMLNHMNDLFISRLDTYYKPRLIERINKNNIDMERNIEDMKRDKNIPKDYVDKHNNTLKLINKNISKALSDIESIKKRAKRNRELITTNYNKVKIIKRVSDSAKESSVYVAKINENLEKIQIIVPDIVEFEYRESDMAIASY